MVEQNGWSRVEQSSMQQCNGVDRGGGAEIISYLALESLVLVFRGGLLLLNGGGL
jgi:hypothetical protein